MQEKLEKHIIDLARMFTLGRAFKLRYNYDNWSKRNHNFLPTFINRVNKNLADFLENKGL